MARSMTSITAPAGDGRPIGRLFRRPAANKPGSDR